MDERNGLEIYTPNVPSALTAVEQSRAIAEVQASLVIARANPRDEVDAERAIMKSCKRPTMAKSAAYGFPRGGKMVTGPSIRLAEVMARCWGNINYGFRELDRGKDYSEVEAFAHDLQTNTRATRQFRVLHIRDKKSGNEAITAERDKYELVASMAQRRVRACLLQLIPGDIIETALETCENTIKGDIGNITEATEKLLGAFADVDVSKEEIEAFIQRKIKSIVPGDIISLRKIYTSIKNGIAAKEEFFRKDDLDKMNARFSGNNKRKETPVDKKKTKPVDVKEETVSDESGGDLPGSDDAAETGTGGSGKTEFFGPNEQGLVACPDAGGMMISVTDCEKKPCRPGCPAWKE